MTTTSPRPTPAAEEPGAVRLGHPDEPVDMRRSLCDALLGGVDWREGFSDDVCVALWLWEAWRPSLEPAGMSREAFVEVVMGYRRELWLWLMGERAWQALVSGLAGRVTRRLPGG